MRTIRAAPVVFVFSLTFAVWAAVHLTGRCLAWNLYRQPILTVDHSLIDLGEMMAGQVTTVTVEFRNTGGRPLMISDVRGSCDTCLKIRSFPAEPIQPGTTGQLEIEVSSGSSMGRTQKQVLISSNDWTGRPTAVKFSWTLVKD